MSWFSRSSSVRDTDAEPQPSVALACELDLARAADRENKAAFDAAAAQCRVYASRHRMWDALIPVNGSPTVRLHAMLEHPEFGKLCHEEDVAKRAWWASRKRVSDLEFAMGVKR